MISHTRFSQTKKTSLLELLNRAYYCESATHTNHLGKTVHPVGLHNCAGNSVLDYLMATLERLDSYCESRKGKKGNSTRKLCEEFVHSFEEFSYLSAEERKFTKEQFINKVFSDVPLLTGEHEDTLLGRVDLHFLPAGYTNHQPPRVFTTDGYGHGKKHLLLEMERVEAEILKVINAKRPPERQILSARAKKKLLMIKKGIKSLGQRLAGKWDGRRKTLRRALLELGYYVRDLTAKTVTVARNAWSKGRRYVIETLNLERLKEVDRQKEESELRKAEMVESGTTTVMTSALEKLPVAPEPLVHPEPPAGIKAATNDQLTVSDEFAVSQKLPVAAEVVLGSKESSTPPATSEEAPKRGKKPSLHGPKL